MWLNTNQVQQYNLPVLTRPRWDFEDWAYRNLPKPENKYDHPYCKQIETILIRALSRNLASLTSLGRLQVARYRWKGDNIILSEDHCPVILNLTDETGTNYLGDYRNPAVYSYPCIGVAPHRIEDKGFVPIFLTDEQLAEGCDWDSVRSLLFRARQLDTFDFSKTIKDQLIRGLRG